MVRLYARVSSEQQSKLGTIDSQITALKERIKTDIAQIMEDICFGDAGVSGVPLVRPHRDRRRDAAATENINLAAQSSNCMTFSHYEGIYLNGSTPVLPLTAAASCCRSI